MTLCTPSHSAPSIKTLTQYVHELKDETPTVFVVRGGPARTRALPPGRAGAATGGGPAPCASACRQPHAPLPRRPRQVGAFAHGKIDAPYVDEEISISQYPLSAAYCLARITNCMEAKWNIV